MFENHGALVGRRVMDRVGGEAGTPYEPILLARNWQPYTSRYEKQWGVNGDKMNCVTESYGNVAETRLNLLLALDIITTDDYNFLKNEGYFDETGKINFNERIPSMFNGTTKEGNWLYKVAEWNDLNGMFPWQMIPDDPNLPWDEYYNKAKVTQAQLNVGIEFRKRFDLPWYWVNTNINDLWRYLAQSPIQIVKPGHAIAQINQASDILTYLDTYDPYIKTINVSGITDALSVLLKPKKVKINMAEVINDNGTIRIQFGAGKPGGFNIGVASKDMFDRIVASGEDIAQKVASTPEEMTLSDGLIVHKK